MAATASRPRRPKSSAPPTGDDSRLAVRIPTSALTLDGFRDWATSPDFPEHVRATFVNGEVYLDMSNEDADLHVAIKDEVSGVLRQIARENKLGKYYGDGVLVSNTSAGVSNNPDGCLCGRASLLSGRVRLVPSKGNPRGRRDIEGTPDWVMEVVSDSSVEKDTVTLRVAYHAAGIPEYWLVDARGEDIAFTILYWRKSGYVAAPVKDGWQHSKVFGRDFRLTRTQDEFGLWEYRLEHRP